MARKKIREYDSKRLLKAHIKRLKGIDLPLNVAQVECTQPVCLVLKVACKKLMLKSLGGLKVRADTNFVDLLDSNPWLKSTRLVVKPDMLFGKRGKHDLVRL